MKSLKELYRIGPGPSSSHTMGPQKACLEMLKRCPNADHYRADLYGSLAMTGKGHLSDQIIIRTLAPRPVEVCFHMNEMKKHPNTLELHAFDAEDGLLETMTVYSVGGGVIEIEGEDAAVHAPCYPHHTLDKIKLTTVTSAAISTRS